MPMGAKNAAWRATDESLKEMLRCAQHDIDAKAVCVGQGSCRSGGLKVDYGRAAGSISCQALIRPFPQGRMLLQAMFLNLRLPFS